MKGKKYLWGVSPLNDFTNEYIAAELAKTCDAEEQIVIDKDGNEVKLYVVEHSFITRISKSGKSQIRFAAYSKEGNRPWRPWLLYKKRPGKMAERAMRMVKKIKKRI
ncbi:MAG: hypothetical protein PHH24_04195 [Candidatus Moranbacteria bacterium]|jgi:hypothetical protein|nr:hypothetical protein [Candidatus Moranbacteria bacterium]MDX9855429.1 hypothetical protein [Candidatus Moranbacteria bacterium]